jgi:hypothetical protein
MRYYSPNSSRILSPNMYDNTGAQYNVSRILNPQGKLDEEAYKSYSPLFLSYAAAWAIFVVMGLRVVAPHLP